MIGAMLPTAETRGNQQLLAGSLEILKGIQRVLGYG
jgi:hypothetical protein